MSLIKNLFKTKKETKVQEPTPEKTLKWEKSLLSVMSKSGWSRDEAKKKMINARKKHGIPYKDYDKFDLYKTPEEELESRYKKLSDRRHAREQCIAMTMDYRGCSREEAVAMLNDARKRLGVPYKIYRRYHFFELTEAEQEERFNEVNLVQESRRIEKETKENGFLEIIKKETGWDDDRLTQELDRSRSISGANITDYYAFRFWELSPEEQEQYFTRDLSKLIADRLDTNEIYTDILLNKELTCQYFSDYMRRKWGISRRMTYEDFTKTFGNGKIVYKPLNGRGGLGIEFFDLTDENSREVYDHIQSLPRGLIEAFVVQHEDLNKLAPNSVNTVRVVTLSAKSNGKDIPEDFFDIAYVALRIGKGDSNVDNFSKGGFVAGVNLQTGIVETDAVDVNGNVIKKHPLTGLDIRGFRIPMYEEIIDFVREMGKKIDGYIGWDIAVSVDGPVLIEANTYPGNRILQTPYAPEKKGMKYVMAKYLQDIII